MKALTVGDQNEARAEACLITKTVCLRKASAPPGGHHVDKILKSAKPSELPVETQDRQTLGLTIPPWFLSRARSSNDVVRSDTS
jgi:hypothetical protein